MGTNQIRVRAVRRAGALLLLAISAGMLTACGTIKDAYMVDSATKEKDYSLLDKSDVFMNGQWVPPAFDVYASPFPGDNCDDPVKAPPPKSTTSKKHHKTVVAPTTDDHYKCNDRIVTPQAKGTNSTPECDAKGDGDSCRSAYWFAQSDPAGARRNRVMSFLIGRADVICQTHEAGIVASGATSNLVLSESATVVGGLGALFTPAATARALSGTAGILNATRDNINQHVFQNLLATAIVKSIEATRVTQRAQMFSRTNDDLDKYSVDQMLADLANYHNDCSFYEGLVALAQAAERVVPSTDEIQARIKVLQDQRKANFGNNVSTTALDSQIAQLQMELALVPGPPPIATTAPAADSSAKSGKTTTKPKKKKVAAAKTATTTPGATKPTTTAPATPPATQAPH